jgi:Uma2 family endonuclease
MTLTANKLYTFEEYLAFEETATEKYQYYHGEFFEMAGGSYPHSVVSINLVAFLHSALKPFPCTTHSSDMRVYIDSADFSSYADAMVICGEVQFYHNRSDVVTNPLLIAEVLSPSTRKFDQGMKFELYRYLPSFEHYLVIEPERAYVEYHQKNGDYWLTRYYRKLEQVIDLQLPNGQIALPMLAIYEKLTVSEEALPKDLPKKFRKKSKF